MAQLPRFDPAEMATKSDLADLRAATKSDLAEVRADMISEHGELRAGLAAVNQRLDRLFLTLLVGMFGVVGSLISLVFTLA